MSEEQSFDELVISVRMPLINCLRRDISVNKALEQIQQILGESVTSEMLGELGRKLAKMIQDEVSPTAHAIRHLVQTLVPAN